MLQRTLFFFLLIALMTAAVAAYAPMVSGFGALDPAGWWRGFLSGGATATWPLFAAAGDMADFTGLAGFGLCSFLVGVLAWLFLSRAGLPTAALLVLPALAASPLCRISFDLPTRTASLAGLALCLSCFGLGVRLRSLPARHLFFLLAGLLLACAARFEPASLCLAALAPLAAALASSNAPAARDKVQACGSREPFAWSLPFLALACLALVWFALPKAGWQWLISGPWSGQLAALAGLCLSLTLTSLCIPKALPGQGLLAWFVAGLSIPLSLLRWTPSPLTPLEASLSDLPTAWIGWMLAFVLSGLLLFGLRARGITQQGARAGLLGPTLCGLIPLAAACLAQPRLDMLGFGLAGFILLASAFDELADRLGQRPAPSGARAASLALPLCCALLLPLALGENPYGPAAQLLLHRQALAPWRKTETPQALAFEMPLVERAHDLLSAAREIFPSTRIKTADVGLLHQGSALGGFMGGRMVGEGSDPSRAMFSILPQDLSASGIAGFAVHFEYLGLPFYKPVLGNKKGTVTLLPRADVWSWLFLRADQMAEQAELVASLSGPGPWVDVFEGGQWQRYQGYLVQRLIFVPVHLLRGGAFFGLALDRFDLGQ